MKVTIRNLGVIKEAEIDLKPLTIFVGPNNSGKTWLAYLLSAIFSQEGWDQYTHALATNFIQDTYLLLESAIQRVLNEGNGSIDLVQFADEQGEIYINNVAHYTQRWLPKYMNTERVTFEGLDIHINIGETKKAFLEKISDTILEEGLSIGLQRKKPLVSVRKEKGKRELYFYTEGNIKGNMLETLPLQIIKEFLISSVFGALHRAFYSYTRVFPTERTTFISMLPRNLLAEAANNEAPLQDQPAATSGPLLNFLDTMINALLKKPSDREDEVKNSTQINSYVQLANMIENNILAGGLDVTTSGLESLRELLFKPVGGTSLEMSVVSSMVKELSPLVLYLRYLAKPGELLVIDEPEMNLHPEAQAKIVEFLAMLVNAGLHLLVTTHSTYIVDHLINLMDAAEHEDKATIAELFFLERTDAFIPREKVSVYLIDPEKEKQAESILDENGIIHWNTFSDVTNRVENIHFKL